MKVRLTQNAGDAFVIEVQRVVVTASEIRFKVDDSGAGNEFFDFGIGIAGKVSDIKMDAEPWGFHAIDDAQKILRLERDAPVILDHEHDTGLFGGGDARADRFNAPIEGVLFGMARDGRFAPLTLAVVDFYAGGTQARGIVDALFRWSSARF